MYGTVVVMATLTAAYASEKEPWKLASVVASTSLVLWIAHLYAHALSRTITESRLSFDTVRSVARQEVGILLATVPPLVALTLGAVGLLRESTAVWLALGIGLFTLAVEGLRYARLERLGRRGTAAAIGLNLTLGLLVVALKVGVAH